MIRFLREKCCPEEPAETPYECRYPLDTSSLFEAPDNLAKGQVEDITPEGRVRMRLTDGVFEYWSERAQHYKYLEAVARKYVIVYDCRDQYVNMFRELLKAREAVPTEKSSAYATFKKKKPSVVNAVANRYKWLGKYVETVAPRGMSYSEFKKLR
jgi:hypothetical protein